jgi:hypothetical protein
MGEMSKEVWQYASHEPAPDMKPAPSPVVAVDPTRDAMSWIRALAHDWEDERSHSPAAK